MIKRQAYLERLILFREKQLIKVVTGVRRCGKSTLFKLYIDYLRQTGVKDEQIIFINLEDMDFAELLDYRKLHGYIKDRLCAEKYTYVFIDEVQNCPGFEKAVDSLFIKDLVDVYINGSNAYMLSGELATLLSGRYVSIDMLPFSFKEYYEAVDTPNRTREAVFAEYLQFGSFPYVAFLPKNDDVIRPYIDGIYNTILIKDVAKRAGINDVAILESIVKVLADSIGSPISVKKISDTLISNGRKISVNTVDNYLKALTDSYIFYKADRFDIKGRQHLKTLSKYYLVDPGLRRLLLAQSARNIGHLLENVVYLELLRRGSKVNAGKLGDGEVDFVTDSYGELGYYQVAATVLDENTLQRELAPLAKIEDNHPKILLTLDEIGKNRSHNGIRQRNVLDWLLEG